MRDILKIHLYLHFPENTEYSQINVDFIIFLNKVWMLS